MEFCRRIEKINAIGISQGSAKDIRSEVLLMADTVEEDLRFVASGKVYWVFVFCKLMCFLPELLKANREYEDKMKSGHSADQTMFSLSWDIEELKTLNSQGRAIHHELLACIECCALGLFEQHNIPRRLVTIRKQLVNFVKRTVHFRRTPATHIFVFMLSSDRRDKKPYALPVQCLPYAGLTEVDMRRLISALCTAMVSHGMKVSGIKITEYLCKVCSILCLYRLCE